MFHTLHKQKSPVRFFFDGLPQFCEKLGRFSKKSFPKKHAFRADIQGKDDVEHGVPWGENNGFAMQIRKKK